MFNELIRKCLTGTVGGLFGIIVSYPFDTVKVRLQTMGSIDYGFGEYLYDGPKDCFYKILRREGFISLYKGVSVALMTNIPITLLTFCSYEIGKQIVHSRSDDDRLTYQELFLIGSMTCVFPSFLVGPTELIKIKLQTPNLSFHDYPYTSIHIAAHMYKEQGWKRINGGIFLTLLRDMPATGVYFVMYEYLFGKLSPDHTYLDEDPEYFRTAFCGGLAGCTYWLLATPLDIIKTRYQNSNGITYPRTIAECLDQIIDEAGHGFKRKVKLFYTGFQLLLIRAFLSHAAIFIGFDIYKHLTRKKTLIELFEETDEDVEREREEEENESREECSPSSKDPSSEEQDKVPCDKGDISKEMDVNKDDREKEGSQH